MEGNRSNESLRRSHTPLAIHTRLHSHRLASPLPDAVLGAIDGCVTTFAVVAGAAGGALSAHIIVLLGLANLVADGFSMAVSNYSAVRAAQEDVARTRSEEERHLAQVPAGEREEIRQIFARKDFSGPVLDRIVDVICSNQKLWVDTMIVEEHRLQLEGRHPHRAAFATFAAFVLAGSIPLLPFAVAALDMNQALLVSTALMAAVFLAIGTVKGALLQRPLIRTALETLALGVAAAALAYAVGFLLREYYAPT